MYLTNTQIKRLDNAFKNFMSKDIKLSKAQLHKITQEGGFLGSILSKFLVPLVKNVIGPLVITAAASAIDGAIQNKMHGRGILNNDNDDNDYDISISIKEKELKDILKIMKSIEENGVFIEGISDTVKQKVNKQKGGLLSLLLGTLAPSILGNILSGKGWYRSGYGVNKNF